MWQQPSGRIISMGLNLLQSLERTTKTKWRWQVRKGDGKLSIASTRNILLTIKECEIQYNSQKKPLCCSAHLQDVFRNSVPHDASIKIHIFLLFLGRNSLIHHLWVSIKTRNNYFLYNNPKGFFLKIIAKSLLAEYWNYTNWNCSEQGLRQCTIHYCWINFLTDINFCEGYFWESHQKYIMVDLSLRANIAHPVADSDKKRLSSKQSLLQVPEKTEKLKLFN